MMARLAGGQGREGGDTSSSCCRSRPAGGRGPSMTPCNVAGIPSHLQVRPREGRSLVQGLTGDVALGLSHSQAFLPSHLLIPESRKCLAWLFPAGPGVGWSLGLAKLQEGPRGAGTKH